MKSIPKNSAGARPTGEIRKGKMLIKGKEAATKRRLEDLKKKDSREEKREREREMKKLRRDTMYFCFLANPTHLEKAVYVFLISSFSPLLS